MERIRAAGAGLGGVLSNAGIGTILEEDKWRKTITLNEKKYFIETPIHAEFALIRAHKADKFGNLTYSKTARNSNPIMAMAAQKTIVEVDEIVEVGELDPEVIVTPGIFINHIVKHK